MPATFSMIEEWRIIPGFGMYEASTLGRIRSHHGRFPASKPAYILKPFPNADGYLIVHLYRGDGPERFFVHELVLLAFVGPCPAEQQCRHGDGNQTNNRRDNLCWGTPLDNQMDRFKHGTDSAGEKCYNAKLTDNDVISIRNRHLAAPRNARGHVANGFRKAIALKYGVSPQTITDIIARNRWKHI